MFYGLEYGLSGWMFMCTGKEGVIALLGDVLYKYQFDQESHLHFVFCQLLWNNSEVSSYNCGFVYPAVIVDLSTFQFYLF